MFIFAKLSLWYLFWAIYPEFSSEKGYFYIRIIITLYRIFFKNNIFDIFPKHHFQLQKTLLPEYNFGALLISLKQKLVFCKFLVLVLFHIIWYLKIFEVSPKDHLMLETSEKEMSEKDAFSAWKKLWCLRLIFLPSWSVWSHKLFFEKIWYKLY